MTDPIALSGAPGSPYTRKMLAVLRYRRIAYRLLPPSGSALGVTPLDGLPQAKVALLPTFYLPDETGALQAVTDSTPLIRRLEREHPGRSVIPTDPALAFLDELIEDYADEWLTKAMFHYRWAFTADADKAASILPASRGYSIPDADLTERGRQFAERQIGRLGYVGSNAATGPVIEASYARFLTALDAVLREQPFILGARPGACDFAVFGQLTQLAQFDPTPMALTLKIAPRVAAWTGLMEDQSGLEPKDSDWISPANPPAALIALLTEIGRVYPPLMLANARAVATGATLVEAVVDGQPWTQAPFPYQAKCLGWLRASHAALDPTAAETIDAVLEQTGCRVLFG
ncbi:glutathione S-transferase family protein [soil metagenome]